MKMDTLTRPPKAQVSRESHNALRSLVSQFITGGMPDPDNPQPPGPWDPVIRRAITRLQGRFSPFPQPWKVSGPLPDPWSWVALNPQPLPPAPPEMAFAIVFAEEVVDHVSRLQDIADVTQSDSPAPAYLSRLVDDIELCPPYWKWPFPPKKAGKTLFDPDDLVTIGVAFEHLAETISSESLRGEIQAAGRTIMEKGAARLNRM